MGWQMGQVMLQSASRREKQLAWLAALLMALSAWPTALWRVSQKKCPAEGVAEGTAEGTAEGLAFGVTGDMADGAAVDALGGRRQRWGVSRGHGSTEVLGA